MIKTILSQKEASALVNPVARMVSPVQPLISPVKSLNSLARPVKRLINEGELNYNATYSNADTYYNGWVQPEPYKALNYLNPGSCVSSNAPKLRDVTNGYRLIEAKPEHRWVTEFMQNEMFFENQYAFLSSDVSSGKTSYITNVIIPRVRRILYVTNRSINRDQFSHDNKWNLNLEVRSYQSLEIDNNVTPGYLDLFDIIVLDESQYFISDAGLNPRTNIMLNKLLSTSRAVKLFMSGTIEYTFEYILKRLQTRYSKIDLANQVYLYRMKKEATIVSIVHEVDMEYLIPLILQSTHKWLIFVRTISEGDVLQKKLGDCSIFLNSESIKKSKKAKAVRDYIVENKRFNHKVVIASSALDSGISIKDPELKSIVIDSDDKVQMCQMLGRKRQIDASDTAELYILHQSNEDVSRKLSEVQRIKATLLEEKRTFNFNNWPSSCINDNSPQGDEYRIAIYNDFQQKKFAFNELYSFYITKRIEELQALISSEDVFVLKASWLLGERCVQVPVGITMHQIISSRVCKFYDVIESWKGKSFLKISSISDDFKCEFTEAYKAAYGINKSEGERSNRVFSIEKIMKILNNLPVCTTLEIYDDDARRKNVRIIDTVNKNS